MQKNNKLLSIILLVSFIFADSAIALPGDSYPSVAQWINKHIFLSPWLEGRAPEDQYMGYEYTAFRQLQDNWFIDIRMTFSGNNQIPLNSTKEESAKLALGTGYRKLENRRIVFGLKYKGRKLSVDQMA